MILVMAPEQHCVVYWIQLKFISNVNASSIALSDCPTLQMVISVLGPILFYFFVKPYMQFQKARGRLK